METNYRKTKNTLSCLKYYFVFSPRYKRKIFLTEGVEKRFKEILKEVCDSLDINIINIQCIVNYVYLELDCLPDLSPTDIVQKIKFSTNIIIDEFEKFNKMPNLWTRNFLVSNKEITRDIIESYMEEQRTR